MDAIERDVEQYLVRKVKSLGGMCMKFIPDSRVGMPDRLVVLKSGQVIWVELKRPKGGKVSAIQRHRHKELRAFNQRVYLCNTRESIDDMLARETSE